jgi:hypothetical protein
MLKLRAISVAASPASCLRSASARWYCVKAVGRRNRTPAPLARSRRQYWRRSGCARTRPDRRGSSASAGRRASWCRPNCPGGCGSRRREVGLAQSSKWPRRKAAPAPFRAGCLGRLDPGGRIVIRRRQRQRLRLAPTLQPLGLVHDRWNNRKLCATALSLRCSGLP